MTETTQTHDVNLIPQVTPAQAYFLVAGKVTYKVKGNTYSKDINCLINSAVGAVNQPQIAAAQQAIQIRFYNEFLKNPNDAEVTDVFLYAISLLGIMTPDEFAPPEFLEEVKRARLAGGVPANG